MLDPIFEFDHNPDLSSKPTKQTHEKTPKTSQNHENSRGFNGGNPQFGAQNAEDESGDSSPPLWKTNSQMSPPFTRNFQGNYRNLSPNSRTQAIAQGQRELMEMVKNMPESSYELSLKDLVEHPRIRAQEACLVEGKIPGKQSGKQVKRQESKKNESNGKMMRSRSSDHNGGFLLKMVFPVSLRGNKKKNKKKSGTNTGSKVSPKPENSDKSSKGIDKDWWKKRRSSGSSGSESGVTVSKSGSTSSSGSSRSGSNNSRRKKSGCSLAGYCSFSFLSKKNKKTAK